MRALLDRLRSFLATHLRRLAPRRGESTARLRKPERKPPSKPPYDLAKDASTDNQKYLM